MHGRVSEEGGEEKLLLPESGGSACQGQAEGEGWVDEWMSPLTFFSCDCVSDEKASSVKDTSVICPGIKIESPDE